MASIYEASKATPDRYDIAATNIFFPKRCSIISHIDSAGRGTSHRLVDTITGVDGHPRWGRWRIVEEELAAAGCAHAVRAAGGAFGGGGGGSGGGGLLCGAEMSHRAAQPEYDQHGST